MLQHGVLGRVTDLTSQEPLELRVLIGGLSLGVSSIEADEGGCARKSGVRVGGVRVNRRDE